MTVLVCAYRQHDISRVKTTKTRTTGIQIADLNTSANNNFEILNSRLNRRHLSHIYNISKIKKTTCYAI